jgi:hypothetical protein
MMRGAAWNLRWFVPVLIAYLAGSADVRGHGLVGSVLLFLACGLGSACLGEERR